MRNRQKIKECKKRYHKTYNCGLRKFIKYDIR